MQRLLSGQADVCELRVITKDGTVRPVRDYTRAEWDDQQGRVTRLYGAARDITEPKASEL